MRKCKCGNPVAGNARFCPKCGHRFTSLVTKLVVLFFVAPALLGVVFVMLAAMFRSNTAAISPAVQSNTVSAVATGEPPTGFRNFKWGAPPRAGFKKLIGPTDEGVTMYTLLASKKPEPLSDLPVAEEDYAFVHGKFYQGDAYLDGEPNFQKMKTALVSKFGNPTFINENLKIYRWKWTQEKIEITLSFQTRFARTTVMFANSAI